MTNDWFLITVSDDDVRNSVKSVKCVPLDVGTVIYNKLFCLKVSVCTSCMYMYYKTTFIRCNKYLQNLRKRNIKKYVIER